jgi:hypothetical protein
MPDDDNILRFPDRLRQTIGGEEWRTLQGEFYLDCYLSQHGRSADDPERLQAWLAEARILADLENPFFRGWLLRRLSEE